MLYVHIPGIRAALIDSADSIMKLLVLKNLFRVLRLMIGCTPPDLSGTMKILLKKPGSAAGGKGSTAPFLIRESNCSWGISILTGFEEDMITGVRKERGGGFLNSR